MAAAVSHPCQICETNDGRYACPRCDAVFCSVPCYRSTAHTDCAELFYRSQVKQLVEGEKSGGERTIDEILTRHWRKLEEGEGEDSAEEEGTEEVDSDDDISALATRMKGVDLDNPDQVWQRLTKEERAEFHALLQSGSAHKLLPAHSDPWWTMDPPLVPPLTEGRGPARIAPPSVTPVPQLANCMINVVAAYCLLYRQAAGDLAGCASALLEYSGTLRKGEVYGGAQEAVEAVVKAASATGGESAQLLSDVHRIVDLPAVDLVLAQVWRLLGSSKGQKSLLKRLEFYLHFCPEMFAPRVTPLT